MESSSDNIVVFTIGRMNPPTPGHLALIEKLIHRTASLGQSKFGIILSHSQDMPKIHLIATINAKCYCLE